MKPGELLLVVVNFLSLVVFAVPRLPAIGWMMNLFLEHVSRSFPGHFMVTQVDQAGWHRSQELVIPANIRLIPQPAYNPEVKPYRTCLVSGMNCVKNTYIIAFFPRLDGLIEALCQGLTALTDGPLRLRSLTSFPHLNVLH
jgi:hypothetical protein